MLYMVTFTINIPQMLAHIPAPWIRHGIITIPSPRPKFRIAPQILKATCPSAERDLHLGPQESSNGMLEMRPGLLSDASDG